MSPLVRKMLRSRLLTALLIALVVATCITATVAAQASASSSPVPISADESASPGSNAVWFIGLLGVLIGVALVAWVFLRRRGRAREE